MGTNVKNTFQSLEAFISSIYNDLKAKFLPLIWLCLWVYNLRKITFFSMPKIIANGWHSPCCHQLSKAWPAEAGPLLAYLIFLGLGCKWQKGVHLGHTSWWSVSANRAAGGDFKHTFAVTHCHHWGHLTGLLPAGVENVMLCVSPCHELPVWPHPTTLSLMARHRAP